MKIVVRGVVLEIMIMKKKEMEKYKRKAVNSAPPACPDCKASRPNKPDYIHYEEYGGVSSTRRSSTYFYTCKCGTRFRS